MTKVQQQYKVQEIKSARKPNKPKNGKKRRIRLSHRNCDRATMRALRIQKKCKPIINAADAQRFSKYAYRLRSRIYVCAVQMHGGAAII